MADPVGLERLEALLRGAEPATTVEARTAQVLAELRGGALAAPERLRARVLAAGTAPSRFRLPSRRLALVLVAAALGLAVVGAAVHGVVSPQPRSSGFVAATSAPSPKAAPLRGQAPSVGAATRAAAPESRGRTGRIVHSALGFLAAEGVVAGLALGGAIALLVLAAAGLALARTLRRDDLMK